MDFFGARGSACKTGCDGRPTRLRSSAGTTAEVWLPVAPQELAGDSLSVLPGTWLVTELLRGKDVIPGITTKWPVTMENHAVSAAHVARPRSARKPRAAHAGRLTPLHLICEITGKNFDYEVPNDVGALKDLWDRRLMMSCPHCRQVHSYLFRSAYVRAVLDDPGRRPLGRL